MNNQPGPEQSKPLFAVTFPPTPHGLPVIWIRIAGFLVILSLVVRHGFPIAPAYLRALNVLDVLLALCFITDLLGALFNTRKHRPVFEARRFEFYILGLFALLFTATVFLPAATSQSVLGFLRLGSTRALIFNLVQGFLLLSLSIHFLRGIQRLLGRGVRPELILAGSFTTLIIVATLLLLLPNSSANRGERITIVDAFFTATSAACVTGLVVRDTGADFSSFGHMVILATFQAGGLGIITFVAFLSVFSTRALPLSQLVAFRQMINAPALSDLKRQLVGIVLATAIIELIGATLIFHSLPLESDALNRVKWSVFHAVSAFCNAGFALQGDSLESFSANPGLNLTIIVLIVLGGLGFLTISELLGYRFTRARILRRVAFFRRIHAGQAPARLSVQTKITLSATVVLLVAGVAMFWALELNHVLRNRSFGESFLAAVFQSVTCRTAGFNTVPTHELRDATLIFFMMLMVIGANPVSTGGGIKTVSFGILLLALRSMIARRERVEAFGRTIPGKTLFAALSVFIIYIICASVGLFLLVLFDPQMFLQDQAFEVISALSTVGLSTGITADLSIPSKLVLCVLMFVGRIGPISLVLSIFQSRRTLSYQFPEEEVIVG